MPRLLLPSSPLVLQFYSHKLLRLAAPVFMMTFLIANVLLALTSNTGSGQLFFPICLAGQIILYASMAAGGLLARRNLSVRPLSLAYTFLLMNLAALFGLVYFLSGKRDVWQREFRV